ncbi:MAG: radical SAM protein [Candidatus Thermoplasmatota archaeon]|jgi:hypothetical protein|nr:radical SAM protein [Candidatus Thermoplasmatota archaeon]
MAQSIKKKLTLYYPSQHHATLSVTGTGCALDCKHCGRKYLENMLDVSTPEKFQKVVSELEKKGIKGILLSGGCDSMGKVPFTHLLDEIKKLTASSDMFINVHTGQIDLRDAEELYNMGIRNVCLDVVGGRVVIKNVYGLEVDDPGSSLESLIRAGFTDIIPHITVGLDGGKLSHEMKALELVKEKLARPEKLVFLSLIPTEGAVFREVRAVCADDMSVLIRNAKDMFPDAELILGCMRPHYSGDEIMKMIAVGLNGVVNPSRKLEEELRGGGKYKIKKSTSCCSF